MLGRPFDSVLMEIKNVHECDHVYFLQQRIYEALKYCKITQNHQLSEAIAVQCAMASADIVLESVTFTLSRVFIKDQNVINFLCNTICQYNEQVQAGSSEQLKRKNDFQSGFSKKMKR
jgi:hypothetical protein